MVGGDLLRAGTSIDRFLLTVSTFSRELNTARKLNDVFSAINNVLKRFFQISSTLVMIQKKEEWEPVFSDPEFPIALDELKTYIDLSSDRKAHSFFPVDEGILLILPSLKSGQVLTVFFALIPGNSDDIRQEFDSIINFISFFSGIVIENLQLYHEVVEQSALQEMLKKYFLTILDSIDEAIMVWNKEIEMSFVNLSFRHMNLSDSVVETVKEIARKTMDDQAGFSIEKEIDEAFYSFNSVWMEAQEEALVRMEDITRSKELERLKRIDQMKTEFVSNISHELRTPLSAIKAYGETIIDSLGATDTETIHEFMTTLLQQSDHLEFLLEQLLDFSKLEDHSLQMERKALDLLPFVELAVMRFFSEPDDTIDIQLDFPDAPIEVSIDRKRMNQVLDHIIRNAIKYRNPDRSKTNIRVSITKQEDSALITIADNGIGIPEESLEKVFEKFYRVDSGLTYAVEGTGLGLAICKEIMEGHKGKIWVESSLESGSTFFLQIPLDRMADAADGTEKDTAEN